MKKIYIDAAFANYETRVALTENGNLEKLYRDSNSIKQLKDNIYLAKVTKVESSLQSAFVEYGGDRHGFLPFSDIHPDYFEVENPKNLSCVKFFNTHSEADQLIEDYRKSNSSTSSNDELDENEVEGSYQTNSYSSQEEIETDDDLENESLRKVYEKYKIQDVIREGQYILVQVVKEERGNKGVALTSYITLAGKYCVLLSNVPGKGGISKKVNSLRDRRKLKNILNSLKLSEDKSLIIRTAGVDRKEEEIFNDYIYLLRLWDCIKKVSKESKAETFIHAEDDILKKCIRDLCSNEVEEIVVEGDFAYKGIISLANMIIPAQKVAIKQHKEKTPIFQKYNIETQIANLYNNYIELPSGGSIVLAQTEALVAIDVNSGRSNKAKNVEDTALNNNLEAAKAIARQLRLRDMAGLIVIDFIDMFEAKNRKKVELFMRDCFVEDSARIQIAPLSIFGLMEISRQRLSASYEESISQKCPCCNGNGLIVSKEIISNDILRAIKYTALEKDSKVVYIFTSEDVSLYILNFRRKDILRIEEDFKINVFLKIEKGMEDNSFSIRKRKSLNSEEKNEIIHTIKTGKVNSIFDDAEMHLVESEPAVQEEIDEIDRRPRKKNTSNNKRGRNHNSYSHKKLQKKSLLSKIKFWI